MADKAEVLHWTPKDYLADYKTQLFPLEIHGAYCLLLWHMWTGSESQCEFPLDYHALASIWHCPPEEAERLADVLTTGPMAVLKIKRARANTVLQSKRLRTQKEQAEKSHSNKVAGGVASGVARRAKRVNRPRTDNEQRSRTDELTYLVSRSPVSRNHVNPVSVMSSEVGTEVRGSYPQDPEPAVAYWMDKLDRDLTPDELSSVKRWVRVYGSSETCVQIGYANQDGYVDNPKRIGGALKASKARSDSNGGAS